MKNNPSFENLNKLLNAAVGKLNKAAYEIRNIPFEPRKQHIHKIAEALIIVHDIQKDIYKIRPDLEPEYLKHLVPPENPSANRAWGDALLKAVDLEDAGEIEAAIHLLEEFIKTEPPLEYVKETKAHIARLKKEYNKNT